MVLDLILGNRSLFWIIKSLVRLHLDTGTKFGDLSTYTERLKRVLNTRKRVVRGSPIFYTLQGVLNTPSEGCTYYTP